jgi:beta-glucanase (GH16 family)
VRNNELQYYTKSRKENARVENGSLIIEARKEPYEGMDYTSASLITKGKQEWTYGRIEVKADLPAGLGMWPAIWMLGVNIDQVGWPDCGEIDIMEYVGFEPSTIYGTVHTGAYNHMVGTAQGASYHMPNAASDLHSYAVEWSPHQIDFFVDDHFYFSFPNDGKGTQTWPFDKPAYLILNIAVGGSWGGMQGVDDNIFPQQMKIDYVKVYKEIE